MASETTQISQNDELGILLGLELVDTEPGIGSLNTLILKSSPNNFIRLWLYMADWAFVYDDKEIASCETPNIGQSLDLRDYFGLKISEIYKFDDSDEAHLVFGETLRLEIWENIEAYGNDDREFFYIIKGRENAEFEFSYP